jgi:hypothetical protein
MSIAVSGVSGSDYTSLNHASVVTQATTVKPSSPVNAPANGPSSSMPQQPLLMIPTHPPLTEQVLAELVGRDSSPAGPQRTPG